MRDKYIFRQKGAALIVVLLVMAVISLLAVNAGEFTRFNSTRVMNQIKLEQAYWYAIGAENFAKELLQQDIQATTINLEQNWANSSDELTIEGGEIRSNIVDLNSCFNLNALSKGPATGERLALPHRQFKALLSEIGVPDYTSDKLRERIKDWIDADSIPSGFQGKEFGYTTDMGHMYKSPNHYMQNITELTLLTELSYDTLNSLKPFLCSLPSDHDIQVNINTLEEHHSILLSALLNQKISLGEASDIISQRPENGYESLDQIWRQLQLKDIELTDEEKSSFTLASEYFRADIEVRHHGARILHYAWLKFSGQRVITIARQYGDSL